MLVWISPEARPASAGVGRARAAGTRAVLLWAADCAAIALVAFLAWGVWLVQRDGFLLSRRAGAVVAGGLLAAGCGGPGRKTAGADWEFVGVRDHGRALALQAIFGSGTSTGEVHARAAETASTVTVSVTRTTSEDPAAGACAIRVAQRAAVRLRAPVGGRAVAGPGCVTAPSQTIARPSGRGRSGPGQRTDQRARRGACRASRGPAR